MGHEILEAILYSKVYTYWLANCLKLHDHQQNLCIWHIISLVKLYSNSLWQTYWWEVTWRKFSEQCSIFTCSPFKLASSSAFLQAKAFRRTWTCASKYCRNPSSPQFLNVLSCALSSLSKCSSIYGWIRSIHVLKEAHLTKRLWNIPLIAYTTNNSKSGNP